MIDKVRGKHAFLPSLCALLALAPPQKFVGDESTVELRRLRTVKNEMEVS
jgi:hypothetical protein